MISNSKTTGGIAEPTESVQQRLRALENQLCVMPSVAAKAIEMVNQPDCSVKDFAGVVMHDAKLATDVLAMANSAAFAPKSPIATLDEAVVRLGFVQCRNLILSSCIAASMKKLPLEQLWIRELLAQHSFTTAMAATHLNRALNIGFQGEEFAAGLIHDFGRFVMAIIAGDNFAEADPMTFDDEASVLEMEYVALQTDHCQLGAWFAKKSQLPEMLIDAILHHHLPQTECTHRRLVALTAAADHIANHLQRFETVEDYDPTTNPGIAVLAEFGNASLQEQFSELAEAIVTTVFNDSHLTL